MNINVAMVTSISRSPVVEVEARLNPEMSKTMYETMEKGTFGLTSSNDINRISTGAAGGQAPSRTR